jgi:DNA-binding NarL/FixJ family response regulator
MTAPITCVLADAQVLFRRGVAVVLGSVPGVEVVGQAADEAGVVRLVARLHPRVAVVDAALPGGGAAAVCRAIARQRLRTAVVALAERDDRAVHADALRGGALALVARHGPPADLLRAVRRAAEHKTFIDADLDVGLRPLAGTVDAGALTPREREVLELLSTGLTTEGVAQTLFLSPATVRTHVESAMRKLGASNRVHAVAQALRLQLIG